MQWYGDEETTLDRKNFPRAYPPNLRKEIHYDKMEVYNRFNPKFIATKIMDYSIVDYFWTWTLVHYFFSFFLFSFFFFEKQHFDEYYKLASKSAATSDEVSGGTDSIQTDSAKEKKLSSLRHVQQHCIS